MTNGNGDVFGRGVEDVSNEELRALDGVSGWTVRKATQQEKESTGIEMVWQRKE